MSTTFPSLETGCSNRPPSTVTPGFLASPKTTVADNDRATELRAAEILGRHAHFHGRLQTIEFRCNGQHLTLCGCLPSYYLKQLAQAAVREVTDPAAIEIVNEINVLSSIGEVGPVQRTVTCPPVARANRRPR